MRSSMRESFVGMGRNSDRDSFSNRNRFESFSRASTPSLYFNDSLSLSSDRPEDLSDSDLLKSYNSLIKSTRQLTLENDIYKRYLERVQPDLLTNVDQLVAAMAVKETRYKNVANMMVRQPGGLHSSMSLATLSLSNRGSIMSFANSMRETYTSPSVKSNERSTSMDTIALNVAHKQEMVVREMEELGRDLETYRKRAVVVLGKRKAKMEQLQLNQRDLTNTMARFRQDILVNGVEALTQKIPAERFIRFLTENLKDSDTQISCLRLKTNMLRAAHVTVQQQLVLKRELNESLCPIDFAQLKIVNETKTKAMAVNNDQLVDLKEMAALFKIRVSKYKHDLTGLDKELARLTESNRVTTERIKKYEEKVETIKREIDRERSKLQKLRDRRKEFYVPDAVEYLKLKMKIFDLNKEIKTSMRKNNVLHATVVNTSAKLRTMTAMVEKQKAAQGQRQLE